MQPLALAFALALMGVALPAQDLAVPGPEAGGLPLVASRGVGLESFAAPRPGWQVASVASTAQGYRFSLALRQPEPGPGQVHAQALHGRPRRVELALRLSAEAASLASRLEPEAWQLSTQVDGGAVEPWIPASAIAEGPIASHPQHHELRFTGLSPAAWRPHQGLAFRVAHPTGLSSTLILRSP